MSIQLTPPTAVNPSCSYSATTPASYQMPCKSQVKSVQKQEQISIEDNHSPPSKKKVMVKESPPVL